MFFFFFCVFKPEEGTWILAVSWWNQWCTLPLCKKFVDVWFFERLQNSAKVREAEPSRVDRHRPAGLIHPNTRSPASGSLYWLKNHKFSKKLMFEGVLWSTLALELLFGWILSSSELDFEWFLSLQNLFFWVPHRIWRDMCEAFQVEELALMISATRGRSRRLNHMCSHLDTLQAMGPVNFRRGAGDFHGVAKQASFYIAFGIDLEGFGEPKSMPKFDFRAIFSDVIFEQKITSKFRSFWKLQTRKITIFHRNNNDFNKIRFFDKDPTNNKFSFDFRRPQRRKFQ